MLSVGGEQSLKITSLYPSPALRSLLYAYAFTNLQRLWRTGLASLSDD